jgi:hypothetical protein
MIFFFPDYSFMAEHTDLRQIMGVGENIPFLIKELVLPTVLHNF